MTADVGGGTLEGESAEALGGEETEVGGFALGEGGAQEGLRLVRPGSAVIASGGD